MTIQQIAQRLAGVGRHVHALLKEQDIMTNDEEHDHAWALAVEIERLDNDLSAESYMRQFAIKYTRIPTNYNDSHVAIIEAETPEDALELLRHQLGDHSGVHNYVIGVPTEYVPPTSKGKIVTLNL